MPVDATTIIGLLVGFLVVGTIGTYVGDQMISAANITGTSPTAAEVTTLGTSQWTVPDDVYSADFVVIGSGGGGGSGKNTTYKGGAAGSNGVQTAFSGVALTPGWLVNLSVGAVGTGGVNSSGTAGANSSVAIGATLYNSAGGAGGANGTASTKDGASGGTGWGAAVNTTGAATAGTGMPSPGAAGALGNGRGAGGSGGGAGADALDGHGGNGARGAIEITYYTTYGGTNPLSTTQQSVVDTFTLGVTLCKIIVIVSIASIVFVLLQKTGLIPRFGGGE
jgi:hypothetical protein